MSPWALAVLVGSVEARAQNNVIALDVSAPSSGIAGRELSVSADFEARGDGAARVTVYELRLITGFDLDSGASSCAISV
ncbi:MAG: hypothetical protein HC923_11675, partial [Myxococcales bacterium]|nr:hypothetical protein [Myxococcales bacterium]